MWTSTLLLTCCLWAAHVQSQDHEDIDPEQRRSGWEDIIEFRTKGTSDECTMSVAGQSDLTKLRITCLGMEFSYWCEYQGKPQFCISYRNNQVHYFRQIMWNLRKLQNACQGQHVYKPHMCKRATDEAQMVFTSSSSSHARPMDSPYRPGPDRPVQRRRQQRPKPTRPQILRTQPARAPQYKPNQPKAVKSTIQRTITPKPTVPQPTTPVPLSESKKLAQDYCWRSFRGVCSFFIGWFRN